MMQVNYSIRTIRQDISLPAGFEMRLLGGGGEGGGILTVCSEGVSKIAATPFRSRSGGGESHSVKLTTRNCENI